MEISSIVYLLDTVCKLHFVHVQYLLGDLSCPSKILKEKTVRTKCTGVCPYTRQVIVK